MNACRALVLIALTSTSSLALAAVDCRKPEYAELKDSDKAELIELYCGAKATAALNGSLASVAQDKVDLALQYGKDSSGAMKEKAEHTKAQVGCLEVAEASERMLLKKYKSKSPSCPS